MALRIRQAGFGDVAAITACVASVRAAYGSGNINLAEASRSWELTLNAGLYVWVAVDETGEVAAVASAQPADEADAPQPLQLATLAVGEAARGSAVVDRLLEFCIGDAPAYAWVSPDPWLDAFLERHGFIADGRRQAVGDDPELRRWSRAV